MDTEQKKKAEFHPLDTPAQNSASFQIDEQMQDGTLIRTPASESAARALRRNGEMENTISQLILSGWSTFVEPRGGK